MLTLGLDIGSTTCKAVVIENGETIIATALVNCGIGTKGAVAALEQVLKNANCKSTDINSIAVTGYGRTRYEGANFQVSEITCHGLGAHFTFPTTKTVIDIGGQDAKVISLGENGQMKSFLMNDKCAAGTGRFLEVMARILQISMNQMGPIGITAQNPCSISSTCTVFAESEVISQLANGVETNDLIAGICNSVAGRVGTLAQRIGIKEDVVLSGGVAQNICVHKCLEKTISKTILVSPNAQLFGAIGAAIYAFRKSK